MKKLIYLLLVIVTLFFAVLLSRTQLFTSKQILSNESLNQDSQPQNSLAQNSLAQNFKLEEKEQSRLYLNKKAFSYYLSKAIKYKTISNANIRNDEEFYQYISFLEDSFPKVHQTLTKKIIKHKSLLFIWKGKQADLDPVLFVSHSDVVPVESTSIDHWKYPPFSGQKAEGYIWGRGTLDNKSTTIGQLLAFEKLITDDFQPDRTLILAIGSDEEAGGKNGAKEIASYLSEQNIKIGYILDEGGIIANGILPSISKPIALIGIAEKGYVSLLLEARHSGGHASMPPPQSAIDILSSALYKLKSTSLAAKMTGPVTQMFEFLGPEMNGFNKVLFANLWLFKPLIKQQLSLSPSTNATIRTTAAITKINGGVAENVLPASASATVNIRLIPGDTIEAVLSSIQNAINDPRITLSILPDSSEASSIADIKSPFFTSLQKTVSQIFPNTLVAPYLTITATDSRHFKTLSRNIYRFSPIQLNKDDLTRIHGHNERISTANFSKMVNFYKKLVLNLQTVNLQPNNQQAITN